MSSSWWWRFASWVGGRSPSCWNSPKKWATPIRHRLCFEVSWNSGVLASSTVLNFWFRLGVNKVRWNSETSVLFKWEDVKHCLTLLLNSCLRGLNDYIIIKTVDVTTSYNMWKLVVSVAGDFCWNLRSMSRHRGSSHTSAITTVSLNSS